MDPSQALIPGLADDAALSCLSAIPYRQSSVISKVCRAWRNAVQSGALFHSRTLQNRKESILCVFLLDQGSFLNPSYSGLRMAPRGGTSAPMEPSMVLRDHELQETGRGNGSFAEASRKLPATRITLRVKAISLSTTPASSAKTGFGVGKPSDWFWLPPLRLSHEAPCDLWDVQIVAVRSKICVLGGTVRIAGTSLVQELRQEVWVYDGVQMTWHQCPNLDGRGKKLVASGDDESGRIFVAWSDEPQVPGSSPVMKVLDVEEKVWVEETVPDMPKIDGRRYLHGSCCRDGKFHLFLIDPDSGRQWSEFYDPRDRSWGSVDGMPTKKSLVNVGGHFVSIGSDVSRSLSLGVDRFDFSSGTWERVRELAMVDGRRSGSQTTVADCFLVSVPRGEKKREQLCVIGSWHQYSTTARKWEQKANVAVVELNFDERESRELEGKGNQKLSEGLNHIGEGAGNELLLFPRGERTLGSHGVLHVRLRSEGRACIGGAVLTL